MINMALEIVKKGQLMSLGFNGEVGFLGRWQISKHEFKDFGKDLWQKGTDYRIVRFATNKDDFLRRCLKELCRRCPASFVSGMKNVEVRQLYVPMVEVGNRLISLHSKIPELSFDFFTGGVILNPGLESQCFDPDASNCGRDEYEYLAIWLSPTDVLYETFHHGIDIQKDSSPRVVIMPVNYLSFDSGRRHYTMMSWGDKDFKDFTTTDLPEDEHLTQGKLVYSFPVFTIGIIFICMCVVCVGCFFCIYKMWNLLDWEPQNRILVFSIPALIIYVIAWFVFMGMGGLLSKLFFWGESLLAKRKQKSYVEADRRQKSDFIQSRFPASALSDSDFVKMKFDEEDLLSKVESIFEVAEDSVKKIVK